MEYKAYAVSNVGKVRSNNEDAYAITEREGFFLVADGMGGHKAGEVAAALTRDIIQEKLSVTKGATELETQIRSAFSDANTHVHSKAGKGTGCEGMGCTCVVVMLRDQNFYLAHVGDSRAYLFRKGELKQMTRDHSYVEELFIRGLISEAEKVDHPYKHQITRYVGCTSKIEVDITSGPVWNGDYFMLCSDGLSEMVSFERIQEICGAGLEAKETAEKLVEEALNNGGKDNVTVVVVQVTSKKTNFFRKILGW